MTICTYFQSPFNRSFHMKFEENWPRDFRLEKSFKGVDGLWTASDHNSLS